jgi:hypothetical protein
MRRTALGILAALAAAPTAVAADRTDRIPAAVGPTDFRSYFVNPSANLPAGVTAERWQAVAKRAMERWGATYLGPTTASPDIHSDGVNVIGFSTALDAPTAGRNSKRKAGTRKSLGTVQRCEPAPGLVADEAVRSVVTPVKLKLRADVVKRKKVRKRFKTVTRSAKSAALDSTPKAGQRCVTVTQQFETDPATVYHESDVQMDSTPGAPWYSGPDHPPSDQLDLESVLLHELGHAAGLAHQPQDCDPSTPMRPSSSNGEYWRGVDEVFYLQSQCGDPPYPVTPDTASGPEGAFAGGSLGGRTFFVNPAVPDGYDGARFVALVQSVVVRWGGTFGGTASEKPTQGDGRSVIGFDTVAASDYEATTQTTTESILSPAHKDCALTAGPVSSFKVKRVTKKVRVRLGGRRKTLKLRRDRVVETKAPGSVSGTCTDVPARTDTKAPVLESDVGIAHEMSAYELGPKHPVNLTRVDMATMLADALGRIAGAPVGDRCAKQTPVADGLEPGDWWRSPTDARRVKCPGGRAAAGSAGRSDRVETLLVQD